MRPHLKGGLATSEYVQATPLLTFGALALAVHGAVGVVPTGPGTGVAPVVIVLDLAAGAVNLSARTREAVVPVCAMVSLGRHQSTNLY